MANDDPDHINLTRRRWLHNIGAGAAGLGTAGVLDRATAAMRSHGSHTHTKKMSSGRGMRHKHIPRSNTVAADATDVPQPIDRNHTVTHDVHLQALGVEAPLDVDAPFMFMTFDGQAPGPMIRVRQGDTLNLTLASAPSNTRIHNVDLHAVIATGGGSKATTVAPGESRTASFQCHYPGAYVYHCAVPGMDEHISRGMFGMIVVEPREGLPRVDREFYLGQHDVYTQQPFGARQPLDFDWKAMAREQPNFVVFNGLVDGYTRSRLGRLQANVGETVRVFMVNGGPNLASSFHPIGNVWARAWPQGAFANPPLSYIQTQTVPPGSCFVGEMELPVAETISLVDHAMSRVVHHGLKAEIDVKDTNSSAIG